MLGLVRRGRRGGDSVRRRDQRRRRGRAQGQRRLRRRGQRGSRCARPCAGGRSGLASRPDPGRDTRAGAERATGRARPHAAPLPAVVRVLDSRRLDRHPRGRAFRDRLDAHRRPRRVGARDHSERRMGEPAAPGLWRRAQPRPDADRLGGDPGRDHRGLGAGSRAPCAQGLGRGCLPSFAAGAEAVRALGQSGLNPAELPPARRGRGRDHPRLRGRERDSGPRLRVGPPARRRTDGSGARALP